MERQPHTSTFPASLHGKLNLEVSEVKDVLLPQLKFIFALQSWALGHQWLIFPSVDHDPFNHSRVMIIAEGVLQAKAPLLASTSITCSVIKCIHQWLLIWCHPQTYRAVQLAFCIWLQTLETAHAQHHGSCWETELIDDTKPRQKKRDQGKIQILKYPEGASGHRRDRIKRYSRENWQHTDPLGWETEERCKMFCHEDLCYLIAICYTNSIPGTLIVSISFFLILTIIFDKD